METPTRKQPPSVPHSEQLVDVPDRYRGGPEFDSAEPVGIRAKQVLAVAGGIDADTDIGRLGGDDRCGVSCGFHGEGIRVEVVAAMARSRALTVTLVPAR